jgi:hypothetical protein
MLAPAVNDEVALDLRTVGPGRALLAQGDRLYLSRGYAIHRSDDRGATWSPVASLPARWKRRPGALSRLAARLLRYEVRALAVLSDGSLAAANRDWIFHARPGATRMRPSTVVEAGQPVMLPNSITVGPGDRLVWGEYNPRKAHGAPVRIYASEDAGARYEVAHVLEAGSVMHVHEILFDEARDHYWVFTGDFDEEPGIGMLSRDLQRLEWLAKGEQRYRLCVPFDFGDRFVYATDTPLARNAILSVDKQTGRVRHLQDVEGSCIYGCRFGSVCALSTTVEPSTVNSSRNSDLWVSRDGERWTRVLSARKDRWHPVLFQFGSLVLPRGRGDGETVFFSGQAVRGYDGRAFLGSLQVC